MRTLLRHPSSGQYFQSLDSWTYDPEYAHDFRAVARAIKFALKSRLNGLELVVSVDDPRQVRNTPFKKFWSRLLKQA